MASNAWPIRFLDPGFLWLLCVPGILVLLCAHRLIRRVSDVNRYRTLRVLPLREILGVFGSTLLCFALTVSVACLIIACAKPQIPSAPAFQADNQPIDVFLLQDGSASVRVMDAVNPVSHQTVSRWQRSMAFLKTFAARLPWKGDRVALVAFAARAAAQARLTSDINVLRFAFDHLKTEPPFPLDQNDAWDTDATEGIYWSLGLLLKDAELFGWNNNPKGMVIVSDGQVWSEKSAEAIRKMSVALHIPIFTVGVGTVSIDGNDNLTLHYIPESEKYTDDHTKAYSSLDRESLMTLAESNGGHYFELGKDEDSYIADTIISSIRHAGKSPGSSKNDKEDAYTDIYWMFLLAAGVFLGAGLLTLIT